MSKPSRNSTLYRLIEAGQLAHQRLLVPLVERGLEPGDDAVLFVLGTEGGITELDLGEMTGLAGDALVRRVARLIERDLILRDTISPDLLPTLRLTDRGDRIRTILSDNWQELEEALLGELTEKKRKGFGKTLKRFVDLLRT
jgi:DNA-binding MarR family transcriptional regulator